MQKLGGRWVFSLTSVVGLLMTRSLGVTEGKSYVDTQALTSAGQAQLQCVVGCGKGFPTV